MKTKGLAIIAAAATALLTTGAQAHHASAGENFIPRQLVVSCARYISKQVVWDRPMPVFLDGLITFGYTPERAESIGNRICRDEAYVGNMEGAGERMREYLRTNPPLSHTKH